MMNKMTSSLGLVFVIILAKVTQQVEGTSTRQGHPPPSSSQPLSRNKETVVDRRVVAVVCGRVVGLGAEIEQKKPFYAQACTNMYGLEKTKHEISSLDPPNKDDVP